jgi:hypothetical protein
LPPVDSRSPRFDCGQTKVQTSVHRPIPSSVSRARSTANRNAYSEEPGPAEMIIMLTKPAQNQKYWPSLPVIL